MGIKVEWSALVKEDPGLITVLPTDTVWPDPAYPRFGVILSDQTATMQQMNFSAAGQVITTGQQLRARIIAKFVKENLGYGGEHLVLLWDKPWKTCFRKDMYSSKRYVVPAASDEPPRGKIRGVDGRFYYPHEAPLPLFDPATNAGVKPADLITDGHMYPLPQLLSAPWTKAGLAAFICRTLWDFAAGREEHIVFDTPFLEGDDLADGQLKCNKSDCQLCPRSQIPRHSEADVLFHFHILHLHKSLAAPNFLVRGTNDRDLLVVLSFPHQPQVAEQVWWCKGTNKYAMAASGKWTKPGPLTGSPVACNEFVPMQRVVQLLGGKNRALVMTRLLGFFLLGADYCNTPHGLTSPGVYRALMAGCIPFVYGGQTPTQLSLHVKEFHYFVQHAKSESPRCRTQLETKNLLECTLRAFYSLAYYTGFHRDFHPDEKGVPVGPDVQQFGFTDNTFQPKTTWSSLFSPMLRPVMASTAASKTIVIHSSGDSEMTGP